MTGTGGPLLVICHAQPGTDSAEKLTLLGSLAGSTALRLPDGTAEMGLIEEYPVAIAHVNGVDTSPSDRVTRPARDRPRTPGHDFDVRAAFGASQHDPAPQRQGLCTVRPARPTLERLLLIIGEHELPPRPAPARPSLLPKDARP